MKYQTKSTLPVTRPLTTMFATLILLAISTGAHSGAHTQGGSTGMDRLTKRLDLTDEQRPQVAEIMAESGKMHRSAMVKPFRDMTEEEREALGDEMTAIREATDAKLAKVLSADQMAELRELREDRLEAMRDRRKEYRKRRDAGMDGMARRLDLTDQQREQVQAILNESSAMRRYVINKPFRSMSEAERESASEEMAAIREETDMELAKVLSPDQMAELRVMREERMEMFRERRQKYQQERGS